MAERKKAGEKLTVWVATDLHYLSPSLYDDGEKFRQMLQAENGKLTEYGKEILDTFRNEVLRECPDALLLCGDLTFNGEMQSLIEIRDYLRCFTAAGIRVFVIPGNHDISHPRAYRYIADQAEHTESITQEDFRRLMREFGPDQALSVCADSFSYAADLAENLRLIAVDTNTEQGKGTLTAETFRWLREQLERADEENVTVVSLTHQNVLKQSDMMYRGFVINEHEQIRELYAQHGVILNLSGHSHLQHVSSYGSMQDICTESLLIYPLRYGVLRFAEDRTRYDYQRKSLGILQKEAYARFAETVHRMIADALAHPGIPPEDAERMTSYAVEMSAAYFCGELGEREDLLNDPRIDVWRTYAEDAFWYGYLQNLIREGNAILFDK